MARPPKGQPSAPGTRKGIETLVELSFRRRGEILLEAGGAGGIEDVDEETSGVEINAAVILVLGLVHALLRDSLATGQPDPASWLVCFGNT